MKWMRLIFVLLPVLYVSACRNKADIAPGGLRISIEFPAATLVKSASDNEFPATPDENTINDLKIWVFKHEEDANHNHKRLAYLELGKDDAADFPTDGVVKQYVLTVEDSQFSVERPNVDVFVLVNSTSIGCSSLGKGTDWAYVKNATFGGSFFGPGTGAVKAVSGDGLPMSACGMDLPVQGEDPSLKVATISLRRCVSKVQFFFSQTNTEGNDSETVTIHSIKLFTKIPTKEYVFSSSGATAFVEEDGYVDDETVLAGPGVIRKSDTPELYAYAGQDGVSYKELLDYGVKTPQQGGVAEVTPGGEVYLRESDIQLEGEITYTVTVNDVVSTPKTQKFSMKAPGEFSRNHCWIVYGYFISNRTLQLSVHVLEWDMNRYTIEFKNSSLMVTQKLMVDRQSVASYVPWEEDPNQFDITLYSGRSAHAYLYISTPKGGLLQIYKEGNDAGYFSVTDEAPIDPDTNLGRIDIYISKADNDDEAGGKSITLSFKAFTQDGRPVGGQREFVDQIYHFILPE